MQIKKIIHSALAISILTLLNMQCYAVPIIKRDNLNSTQQAIIQKAQEAIPNILKQYQIPGAAVALVDEKGIIWAQGFGITDSKTNNAVTPETLFSLQSQTKMITALGVMRAVQSGLLTLETPIANYLPNLKVYSVFESDPANKITLKHLLSHTAGFAHDAPVGNNNDAKPDFMTHMKSILDGTWLQFPVGRGYNYSNVGVDLAGYILQVKSDQSFQNYMEQQVLLPLQMNASTFSVDQFLKSSNHAVGHIQGFNEPIYNYSTIPSGGLFSNVIDMAHYIEFQLNAGSYQDKNLLKFDLLQTLLNIPFPLPGQVEGGGLGIWKGKRLNSFYYTHLGRGFGFANDLEWYPEFKIGIIVLTNKYDVNNVDVKIAHFIIDPWIADLQQKRDVDIKQKIIGEYISFASPIEIINDKTSNQLFLKGTLNEGPEGNNMQKVNEALSYIGNATFLAKNSQEQYRYIFKGPTGVPMIERTSDGFRWYLNYSDNLPAGPNKTSWKKYIGKYSLPGYSTSYVFITEKHGYLYFNDLRLNEFAPGVFAAANGQMLVFDKEDNARWDNLTIFKTH